MAYASVLNQIPGVAWWLLLANIAWTMAYDTEYAMVDREDDRKLGLRTSAVLFGRFDVAAVMFCHALFVAIMIGIGTRLQLAWPYYAGLAFAVALAIHQYRLIRARIPSACFEAFLNNNRVGAAVFIGIVLAFHLPR
jgi:4-hydroxybenzoate polyprenyltransferase